MPAVISQNNILGNSGLQKGNSMDTGGIVAQNAPGKPAEKLVDGTVQDSTTLTCDATPGAAGNYTEPAGQNNSKSPATITNVSRPANGTITAVAYAAGTLTVTIANTFAVGDTVNFSGVGTNTTLNGRTATVATASGTQFTAVIPGLAITNGAETGTVSDQTTTITAANNFTAGQNVVLNGLTTNTVLNRQNASVVSATGASFKVLVVGGVVTNGADTGTATYNLQTRGAGLSLYGE